MSTPTTKSDTTTTGGSTKKPWLKYVLIGVASLLVLLVLTMVGLRLYFSDTYIKEKVTALLQETLGRPCSIGDLNAGILSGTVTLKDIRVLPAQGKDAGSAPLSLARADAQVPLWTVVMSSFKELKGIRVDLEGLKLEVERKQEVGHYVTNWDDVIARLTAGPPGTWPKSTGFKALEFQLHLKNSDLSFKDEQYGVSKIEGLTLDASQPGLGQEAVFRLAGALQTPRNASPGKVQLEGAVVWIDDQGRVGPTTVHDAKSSISLQDADIGQLAQYAGVGGTAKDGEMCWTLGQKFSGELKAAAPQLDDLRLSFVLETDELMAVCKTGADAKRQPGLLPAKVDASLSGGWKNGALEAGPLNVSLDVAASSGQLKTAGGPRWIAFRMGSQKASVADEPFSLSLQADVTALCSSNIGEALGLKGQYGGRLDARANVNRSADGLRAKGNVKTEEFFVAIEGARQPSGLQLEYDLTATQNKQGVVDQVSGTLTAQSRPFTVTTVKPLLLKSLSTPEKVQGVAQLSMSINGRELWKEFGPLLKVINMGSPLEEAVNGELSLSSEAGKLKGSFQGTLQRQHPEPRPIILKAVAEFELAARERMDGTPFANFDVQLSTLDKSFVKTKGQLTRTKSEETWELSEFKALGSLVTVSNINERFGKYVSFFLGSEYDVKGFFDQTAHSKLVRHLNPDGSIASQSVSAVTDLRLQKLDLRGPALVKGGIPLRWEEKEDVTLHLELVQGVKQVPNVGVRDTVAIPSVVLKSGSLNLEGSLSEAEVAALSYAANATTVEERFKRWMTAMPSAKLDASVNQASVKRLQDLGILPNEPLLTGSLRIKAAHDAASHRVDVEKLDLQHTDWTLGLAVQGLNIETLGAILNQPPKGFSGWQKAVPSLVTQASLKPAGVERLQALLKDIRTRNTPATQKPSPAPLWEDPALVGQLELALSHDAAKGTLALNGLTFTSGGTAAVNIAAPAVPVASILGFLDRGKPDLTAVSSLLTDCSLEIAAGPRLFNLLKQDELLPKGLDLAGLLTIRARYEQERDHLVIEQLDFVRTQGSPCFVTKFALTKPKGEPEEIARLRGLLTELDFSKPLNTLVGTVASHLDMGIHIQELEASTSGLLTYFRSQGWATGFIGDVESGVYRLSDTVRVNSISARKGDKAGSYELFGAVDLAVGWHPRSGSPAVPQKDPATTLAGTVKLSPTIIILDPLRIDADATVLLDDLHVTFGYAAPYFVYEKPAAMPCRLRFAVGVPDKGGVRVPNAALTGGPLNVTITDLQQSAEGAWTCELMELRDGPLPGKLSGFLYDTKADRLKVAFDASSVDMASAVKYASLPRTFTATGSLDKIHGSYDGRVSVLPDRMGEQDKAEVQCVLRDVVLSGRPIGKSADLSINGALNASPYLLASRKLDVGLNYGVTGQPAVAQRMAVSIERVSAREPRVALPTAFLAEGLPLLVRGQIQAETPVDVDAILDGIAALSESVRTGSVSSTGASDLSGIGKLRLELSVAAPAVSMGSQPLLKNLQVPQVVFDALKISIPLANADAYDGQFILREALYDISVAPIKHSQKITISDADLHLLTFDPAKPPAKDSYQVFGKLSATGSLAGTGFTQRERASWQGELKSTIQGLVLEKQGAEAKKQSVGGGFVTEMKKFGMKAMGDTVDGLILPGTGKVMQLYQDDFGLFLTKMEFQDADVLMTIRNGLLDLPQGSLVGKAKNDGLAIGFMGKIDLPTESFKPTPFRVWPMSFPPATQKLMRLDELTEPERESILKEFRKGNPSLWLSGPIANPSTNSLEFAKSFQGVLSTIDRMIAAKKQGQPPGTGTDTGTGAGTDTGTGTQKKSELPFPISIPDWLKKR